MAEFRPLARLQVLKNIGSRMFMLRVKTLSAAIQREIATFKIRDEKLWRAQQYKSVYASLLTKWLEG